MIGTERFNRLAAAIYDAAVDPGGWAGFLDVSARALNGTMAGLIYWDRASKESQIPLCVGMDPQRAREYDEYYAARNPWLTRGAASQRPGLVIPSQLLYPVEDLLRTEFYNDYLRRCDLCYGVGARIAQTDSLCINLSILRPRRSGTYGEPEVRLLKRLMPHLQRGFRLHRRFAGISAEIGAATAAMEGLPFGVLLLDAHGLALFVNREARRILDERDGLTLARDGLRASTSAASTALRKLIDEASFAGERVGTAAGGSLSVGRPSMKRPLGVLVSPLPAARYLLARRRAVVAVFVSDPEHTPEPPETVVRAIYGLTPAEAALAVRLTAGHSVESAAAVLGIAVQTARTQLKRVFRKTNTGTQTQLVRLLLSASPLGHA